MGAQTTQKRISLVVPTYNERKNIRLLVEQLFTVAEKSGLDLELVIVDDNSPDGTGEEVDTLAKRFRIVPVHRPGKMGLGSAVYAGFEKASGDILGVMDADLSHPPGILPELVGPILRGEADMAIGSRYSPGGGVEVWPVHRKMMSLFATILARPLTGVRDPMSGLFAFRRKVIEGQKLRVRGYKCCMEILVRGKVKKVIEVPYTFKNRLQGESKLGVAEYRDYLANLARLYASRIFQGKYQ